MCVVADYEQTEVNIYIYTWNEPEMKINIYSWFDVERGPSGWMFITVKERV